MKLGGKGKRKFRLYSDGVLSLHIFVDKTAVEIFFQHGEEAASFFLFPEKNIQPELRIYSVLITMSLTQEQKNWPKRRSLPGKTIWYLQSIRTGTIIGC